nr:uncharacterized protein CI109_005643 [Kwoniella shandongensis]KAA5526047.1 hypothetical protein CI109_005643 [Kwoniella shandongensis]
MAGMENSILRRLAYVGALPAVHGLKFPTYQRAPILPPPSPSGKWPLIIFSHGVGCSRLMYTQICGELASRGYVVAAVEHRDGTGPSARITSEEGQVRDVDFLRWTDLNWPELEEQPKDDTTLRHDQLKIRLAELDSTLQVIRKIVQGRHVQPALMASRTLDWEPWKNVVEVGDGRVCFAGHSFGGTAVIAAAADPRFTPSSIIALDPAVQRIEPWTSTISCPTLSVNSEEFGHQEDYERLLGVSKTVNAEKHIFTIAGATHPSFSDVFLITPGFVGSLTSLSVPPYEVFVRTLEVIETFLRGTTESAKELESVGTPITTMPPKPIGKPGEVFRQVE